MASRCVSTTYRPGLSADEHRGREQRHDGPTVVNGTTIDPGFEASFDQYITIPALPADLVHVSGSVPISNPLTKSLVGISFTITADRYSAVYISVNLIGGLPTALGFSVMAGWMNSSAIPAQSALQGMQSKWDGGFGAGYSGVGGGFYRNNGGTSESVGVSSTGVSAYG